MDGTMTPALVSLLPDRIRATDTESGDTQIRYSFQDGSPRNFGDYFEIHPSSALVRQLRPVKRSDISRFDIVVKVPV